MAEYSAEQWEEQALSCVTLARDCNDVRMRDDLVELAGRAMEHAFVLRRVCNSWKDSSITLREIQRRRWQFAHNAAWLENVYFPLAELFTTSESLYFWRGQDLLDAEKKRGQ
jgi:hypothetical protein